MTSKINVHDPERAIHRAVRCKAGELAPYVLLPGDPARAAMIGTQYFENGAHVVTHREFTSYTGTYRGIPVSVVSTGIGCPSAAMAVQDLVKLGSRILIRVGTAGSIQPQVAPGDVVIATGAVRDEGLTPHHVPVTYPAIAHRHVVNALEAAAADVPGTGQVHCGIVHTTDAFFTPKLSQYIDTYRPAGVMAFEMEAAAVLTLAAIHGVTAGAVFSIDGYVGNVAQGNVVPDAAARDRGVDRMIRMALAAIERMVRKEG